MKKTFWGKQQFWEKENCIYCGKRLAYGSTTSGDRYESASWICNDCADKLKFKKYEIVWFPKYNRDLDKIEIIKGCIVGVEFRRIKTYSITHRINDKTFKSMAEEDFIFRSREECVKCCEKYGKIADDTEVNDLRLMKLQAKVYKQIKEFLQTDEAVQFNVTGIEAKVENGYVNAYWKFGSRQKGDIKE